MASTTEWQLLWNPLGGGWGVLLAAVVALLVLALSVFSTAGRPRWLRLTCAALRGATLVLVILLLCRPEWEVADVTRSRDHVALVVDGSLSMALPEGRRGASRAAEARRLLQTGRGIDSWKRRYQVDRYRFDQELQRSALQSGKSGPPSGSATRLLRALVGLRQRYQGRRLAGVVVVSDGRDTGLLRGGLTTGLRRELKGLDVPVNVVPVGDRGLRDVAVRRVEVDDLAFVRNVTRVRVLLRVSGAATEPVQVTLRVAGQPPRTRRVQGPKEDRETVFEFVPERVGGLTGVVEAQPLRGEATRQNNRRFFTLRVVRDRIRVLQVAGRPSWEVRFMRQHLKRNPNVDLVSFFILRTHRHFTHAMPSELSLIEFPARELFTTHLQSFDLVILQDFGRYPAIVGLYIDNLAAYVRKGGAVALTGGDRTLTLGGLHQTALADVLPVKLLGRGSRQALLDLEPFRPRWTELARVHPVTRAGGTPALTPALLSGLPPLEGLNRVARARPDAAVLAVHPRLKDAAGQPAPVLALRRVGKGRTLALLTDTSWLWRMTGGPGAPALYDAFWTRAVRYLIGDPEFSSLRILAPAQPVDASRPVRLTLRAEDLKHRPQPGVEISYRVLRTDTDHPRVVRSDRATTGKAGEVVVVLPPRSPGTFRVEASARIGGVPHRARAVFAVEGRARELATAEPNPDLLAAVARATGGRVLQGAGALGRARFHAPRITSREGVRREPLLGSPWLLWLLLLAFLGAEWGLRRRWALA